jgi:electron transfer flavoprotein beta subunit
MAEIAVLVSIGHHPVARKPRRAELDARALALAVQAGASAVVALHAGPADPARLILRDCLGMGAEELVILDMPPDADPLPALLAALRNKPPEIVLAGTQAEAGEGSGMVPIWLAERLGWPFVANIVAIETTQNGSAVVVQALPGGRRRRLVVQLPFIASIGPAGPAPRLSAFAKARRGKVTVLPVDAARDPRHDWPARPARPRPRRIAAPVASGNAASRLDAILSAGRGTASGNKALVDLTPEAAAGAILDFLAREGLLPRRGGPPAAS